jgi:hypothetical protein
LLAAEGAAIGMAFNEVLLQFRGDELEAITEVAQQGEVAQDDVPQLQHVVDAQGE